MTYHPGKPRVGIDPCQPSLAEGYCVHCSRFNLGPPEAAEDRPATVLLDASTVHRVGERCPLFIPPALQSLRRATDRRPW